MNNSHPYQTEFISRMLIQYDNFFNLKIIKLMTQDVKTQQD
jgi:hypothetical protein